MDRTALLSCESRTDTGRQGTCACVTCMLWRTVTCMLWRTARRCSEPLAAALRASFRLCWTATPESTPHVRSGGLMRTMRLTTPTTRCPATQGAYRLAPRALRAPDARRVGVWTSINPLGASGRTHEIFPAASSSSPSPPPPPTSASAPPPSAAESEGAKVKKKRRSAGKKSKAPVVAPSSVAAGNTAGEGADASAGVECERVGWVLLGCDSDTGGALAVVRGPRLGVVASVDVLDAPTMKVQVNGKPRTRLCVDTMVGARSGFGGTGGMGWDTQVSV